MASKAMIVAVVGVKGKDQMTTGVCRGRYQELGGRGKPSD